jgi:hypothetical protein
MIDAARSSQENCAIGDRKRRRDGKKALLTDLIETAANLVFGAAASTCEHG